MSTVRPGSDNVETVHERIIKAGIDSLAALSSQWFTLSREDRREAERCTIDLVTSLRTLGVRL